MGQQLNPFQFIEQQSWSGMTLPYTLGSLAMRKPVEAFNTVTKVFAQTISQTVWLRWRNTLL